MEMAQSIEPGMFKSLKVTVTVCMTLTKVHSLSLSLSYDNVY